MCGQCAYFRRKGNRACSSLSAREHFFVGAARESPFKIWQLRKATDNMLRDCDVFLLYQLIGVALKIFPEIQNLSDALRKQAFLHKRFAKGILEPIESPREVIRRIQMQSPAEMLRHIQMQSPEFIHKSLISPITKLVEELSELPERYREALKSLGKEGWFYSPEMSTDLLSEIDHLLIEDPNGVSEWLCDFFRGRIDDIEQELLEAYPQRKRPLHDAFEAHREGKYSLSVLVFLAQADGIFRKKVLRKKVYL